MRHSTADAAIGAPDDGGQTMYMTRVEVFRGADLRLDVEGSNEADYKSRHPRVERVLKNSTGNGHEVW
jgi:hypothetical protein